MLGPECTKEHYSSIHNPLRDAADRRRVAHRSGSAGSQSPDDFHLLQDMFHCSSVFMLTCPLHATRNVSRRACLAQLYTSRE